MDDGNNNPKIYGTAPRGSSKRDKGYGPGGIGSNNPTPYGSKPSFGQGASKTRIWDTKAGGVGSNTYGTRTTQKKSGK